MRKNIARILYTLFFGFSFTLVISCVLLIVNSLKGESKQGLEAVSIEPVSEKETNYRKINSEIFVPENKNAALDCDYAYQTLSDENERYVYHKLNRNLYYINGQKGENGYYKTQYIVVSNTEMAEESVKRALDAFMTDHPEIFWINNVFGYAYDNGNTVIECYSQISSEECDDYIERMSENMEGLLDGIDEIDDDFQKEKLLHDRLLSKCSYADGVNSISDGWQYFTPYGAIVEGSAVCEGYSKALQILLADAGIPSYTVKGYADDVRHMWNIVELDNSWYHVDPTWNDGEEVINYEFFNLSTYEIEKNHKIDPVVGSENQQNVNYFLPECNSMVMNYYNIDGIKIDKFDNETDREMVSDIVSCANSGNNYLYITVGDDLGYEDCINTLFEAPNHRIYHYIELANGILDSDHTIDRTGIKLLKNEERRTIRVNLNIVANKN